MWKRNWSELKHDLLVVIANHVTEIDDFIRFGAVCKSWNYAAIKENYNSTSPQDPLLMLAADKDDDYRVFYSVSRQTIFGRMYLPEVRGCMCLSTEQPGWLLAVQYTGLGKLALLHPFSRTQIHLPPYSILIGRSCWANRWEPEEFDIVGKAILSANPSVTSDYVVMISYQAPERLIGFWRPGDMDWTSVRIENPYGFNDFRYFNGKFYILSSCCGLWVVDDLEGCHRNNPTRPSVKSRLVVRLNREILANWDLLHLVQVSGALLFVAQCQESPRSNGWHPASDKYCFRVWELDVMTREAKEMKTLGDRAIFLGKDASVSVECPKFIGVKPNHIYFINSMSVIRRIQGWDGIYMRDYSFEDGKIQSFYPGIYLSPVSPPTWVIPSF